MSLEDSAAPQDIIEDKQPNKKSTKKQEQQEELDLVDLNPEDIKTTDDGALKQEGEEEFDPNEYGGFPMEAWNKYVGAINDKQQARTASLAKLSLYSVRINAAPAQDLYPHFKITQLQYYPVTKKAWEQRRMENSQVEDLDRELRAANQHLAEMQESLRLRMFSRNKPRGMITNRDDPTTAQLEEIQQNMKFYADFSSNIGKRLSEKRHESDLFAFKVYFHKGEEVYDQIMNEDLDDILRACDHKQIYGSANLRLSKPLPLPAGSQGIS